MRYIDGGEDSDYYSTSMGSGSIVDLDHQSVPYSLQLLGMGI